jgi:hypothetical protein
MASEKSQSFHITQPDHWGKPDQPALCGSTESKRVAFDRFLSFLAARSVKREEICEACWDEFQKRKTEVGE